LSQLRQSYEYQEFRSRIPLNKISVDDDGSDKAWSVYDSGPKCITCPLVCFPPASGSSEVFFKQLMELPKKNIRVIAVSYPVYWSLKEFVNGFIRLIDHLRLDKVHLFGASLGGFLAQKVCESTRHHDRVASLVLCNSFSDTSIFNQTETANLFWLMPGRVLKRLIFKDNVLEDPYFSHDSLIKDSMVFVAESLDQLSQQEVASRLTLNCTPAYIEPHLMQSIPMTMIDVFDRCALSERVRQEMYKMYPEAKRAHLKTGANFPYLSSWQEVNMFLEIHLRHFKDKRCDPFLRERDVLFEPKGFPSSTTPSSPSVKERTRSPTDAADEVFEELYDDNEDRKT